MGFMDDLFGSSGGQITSRNVRGLTNDLGALMRGQLGQSASTYGGQLVPNMNANTESVLGAAGGLLQGDPNRDAAIQSLLSGAGDPQGVRAYYQSQLAPAQKGFLDSLRVIDDRYGDTWGASGAHGKVVGDATANYGIGLNQLLGQLTYDDRNAARDRMSTGVSASLASSQDQMSRLGTLLGFGDYQRGLEGEKIAADYGQWQAAQAYNNPWLGFLGTTLGTAQQEAPRAGLLEKGAAGYGVFKNASNPLSYGG